MIPLHATPSEVAILRVYIHEVREPKQIARILHYKSANPVYRVIRKYRSFLNEEMALTFHVTFAPLHNYTVTTW